MHKNPPSEELRNMIKQAWKRKPRLSDFENLFFLRPAPDRACPCSCRHLLDLFMGASIVVFGDGFVF